MVVTASINQIASASGDIDSLFTNIASARSRAVAAGMKDTAAAEIDKQVKALQDIVTNAKPDSGLLNILQGAALLRTLKDLKSDQRLPDPRALNTKRSP